MAIIANAKVVTRADMAGVKLYGLETGNCIVNGPFSNLDISTITVSGDTGLLQKSFLSSILYIKSLYFFYVFP